MGTNKTRNSTPAGSNKSREDFGANQSFKTWDEADESWDDSDPDTWDTADGPVVNGGTNPGTNKIRN